MTSEELKRHEEIVAAVLKHMDSLTREEWIARLAWRPEGYKPENDVSAPALSHVNGNGTHARKSAPRKQRISQAV
jgi:hypothetical protein